MGYAVELLIRDPQAQVIRDLFRETGSVLADIGTSPHVSLAVFDDVDVPKLTAIVESIAQRTPPFKIRFSSVGVFPGKENVVFLAPVVTPFLLSIHRSLHDQLVAQEISCDAYYLPGAWVPHCAITVEEPISITLETIKRIHEHDLFSEYEIDHIAVVKFRPVVDVARFSLTKGLSNAHADIG